MKYKLTYLVLLFITFLSNVNGQDIDLKHKNTLSVVEINSNDRVNYTLESGRVIKIKLIDSKTKIIFTTLKQMKKGSKSDASIYSMECTLEIDGQEIKMVRYVPVQQSFYEPYIVNGLMIWFDGLSSVGKFFNENHGECLPKKEARFAFQDADSPICPVKISNWFVHKNEKIEVKNAYSGNDTWMGTYFGADLHGGLDLNMPSNTALYAPIDFEEHYLFNSEKSGHNNNRWRGVKNWDNGDTWYLQTHHLNQLLVSEVQPLRKGQKYAYGAGTWAGENSHTHFVFKVMQPGFEGYLMDPWLIFWQIDKNNKEIENKIKAHFTPLSPLKTAEAVHLNSSLSRPGVYGNELQYFWDFGDGNSSFSAMPSHTFASPGVYSITLIVKDGHDEDVYRQFVTVTGKEVTEGNFRITCDKEPSFRKCKNWKTLTSNKAIQPTNTVYFNCSKNVNTIDSKTVTIYSSNLSWTEKEKRKYSIKPLYTHGTTDWLKIKNISYKDSVTFEIQPDFVNMRQEPGLYEAFVLVSHNDALNSPQKIRVVINIRELNKNSIVTINNADSNCITSSFFWLKPEFHLDWTKGNKGNFLINSNNSSGEYVRFVPQGLEGEYKVSLTGKPYSNNMLIHKTDGFYVIIKHKNGVDKEWIEPKKSLEIGNYEFSPINDNYVEIITDDSEGLIIVDAIKLERQNKR
ncbi:MAG: hypothetical protein COA50_00230 [Flavobacteriaceae bacterium]|nr:MAG: hypothetical protein COA50_00230 [Flavobacteriaceae bacterium]